ncbi:MAG: helix-turn-helix domain-containing protein [Clostridium sp.]|jgi:transcriptional regulator with XRE-family HTH domain|uniref:helix-turn-helix domain-containing protein n=1 Tax=Clostridium sp. TaxID=1506 RepID=UPI0025C5E1C5|nr:helix-turn-helix domain-containing protein [Clostridium sp.]MCH3963006.1 helix-turn-helix domain-containing protein [Clostridium sp.]MCI1800215.1 helix-turn-helix domain-containing protein [Clostridium sp.]MCI2202085.1 helix-turn-helix domain-containing protein [Clostridium sp.]
MDIGTKIKKIRESKNLTQKQLAEKIGVTPVTITRYENNNRKPSIETLNKMAKALNVTINDLAGERDTITKKVLKHLISNGTSLEQISKDTNISINRLNSLLKNTNDASYDEIQRIAKSIGYTDEQIAKWIALDTFTTVIYNNKDANNYQAQFLKKFFLNEKISKEDLTLALLDDDKDFINQFYPYINTKKDEEYIQIPGGFFAKSTILHPGAFYEAIATICYYTNKDFTKLNLSDDEFKNLGEKLKSLVEFELFKISKNRDN